jgi:hypothetical protein
MTDDVLCAIREIHEGMSGSLLYVCLDNGGVRHFEHLIKISLRPNN